MVKRLVLTASGQRWAAMEGERPEHGAFRLSRWTQYLGVVVAARRKGAVTVFRNGREPVSLTTDELDILQLAGYSRTWLVDNTNKYLAASFPVL